MDPAAPRSRPRRRPGVLAVLALIVPLSLYALLATRLLRAGVGYEMDEALYVESAVFLLHGQGTPPFVHDPACWVTVFGRRLPLMIIPYVGAVKAYAAVPLFVAFGANAETARLAGILLGALGIAGLVALIGTQAGPGVALIAGAFLAIHPSYLDFTVFDNGGVSVWMAAMGLVALALTLHLRRGTVFSAFVLGLAAGIGVWGRANVIWLLASAAAAALWVWGRRALPSAKHVLAMAVGGAVGALPLIVYELRSQLATFRYISSSRQELSARVLEPRLRGLADVVISDAEQHHIWGGGTAPSWQLGIGAALLVAVFAAALLPARGIDPAAARWRKAFGAAAAILAGIMLASRLHVSEHHLVAVLPLAAGALSILAVEVGRAFRPAAPGLAVLAAYLAALFFGWDVRIDRGLRQTGGQRVFSSALSDLGAHLVAHPVAPERLKILDWGLLNNLYVASGGAVSGTELYWEATRERSRRGWTWDAEIRDGGTFLLYRFPQASSPLSAASEGFSEALRRFDGPRRETVFSDRSDSPVVALVEVDPAKLDGR
jgi:hypothetical protein